MYTYIAYVENKATFLRRLMNYKPENIIRIKDANLFFVLVKSTHGGGYHFVGHISEQEGHLVITGDIVHNPDRNGNPQHREYTFDEKIREFLQITLVFILFWWVLIIWLMIDLFIRIFTKGKEWTLEEQLDAIMIHELGCQKADELHNSLR